MKKRLLLLNGYEAASHKVWREGLITYLEEYEWTVVTLPPRHFAWRIRGSALSFVSHYREVLEQSYDLVVCTSMVDLAALRGLMPHLAQCPNMLYFHENQFAYPASENAKPLLEAQMVTIYSAMAADQIAFNSHFNRETFITGAEKLFRQLPDFVPKDWRAQISAKSRVIPVPIASPVSVKLLSSDSSELESSPESGVRLVWNHRWEYDKAPDRLLRLLRVLVARKVQFKIHIVGQQFRRQPESFEIIKQEFNQYLLSFGFIESREEYLKVLAQSDVVLSTATHEFEGLAVLEAVAYGCIPLVPKRLSYVELFDDHYLYSSWLDAPEKEANAVADSLECVAQNLLDMQPPRVDNLFWQCVVADYRDMFEELLV